MEHDTSVPIEDPMEVIVGDDISIEMILTMATTKTSTATLTASSRHSGEEDYDVDQSLGSDDIAHLTRRVMASEKVGSILAHIHKLRDPEQSINHHKIRKEIARDTKEDTKRLRDAQKKRIQRNDEEYRKRESDKAKARMATKRDDPEYREMERQRDRERRALARRNKEVRDKEREKDRGYKKKHRNSYCKKGYTGINNYQDIYGSDLNELSTTAALSEAPNQSSEESAIPIVTYDQQGGSSTNGGEPKSDMNIETVKRLSTTISGFGKVLNEAPDQSSEESAIPIVTYDQQGGSSTNGGEPKSDMNIETVKRLRTTINGFGKVLNEASDQSSEGSAIPIAACDQKDGNFTTAVELTSDIKMETVKCLSTTINGFGKVSTSFKNLDVRSVSNDTIEKMSNGIKPVVFKFEKIDQNYGQKANEIAKTDEYDDKTVASVLNPFKATVATHQGTKDIVDQLITNSAEEADVTNTSQNAVKTTEHRSGLKQKRKTPVINISTFNSSFITNTGVTLNDACRVTETFTHNENEAVGEDDFRDSSAIQGLIELGAETNTCHDSNTITLYSDET